MNDEEPGTITVYREPSPAQGYDDMLARMLADQKDLTPEKMEILLRVRRELLGDRRGEAFQIAFAKMAAVLPQVEKQGMVELIRGGETKGSYRYAKWEDMDTVVRPIMTAHGFSLMFQEYVNDKGLPMLRGKLMHVDGHAEISERQIRPDPGPGRNETQAWGSGLSYAKRYLGEGLLNIVRRGVDDDATTADDQSITEDEVNEIRRLLMDTMPADRNIGEYTTRFLHAMLTGIEQVEDIPRRDFTRLKNALADRQRQQQRRD